MTHFPSTRLFISCAIAAALTACTDYPDEWGFDAFCSDIKQKVTNASPAGFDSEVTAHITISNPGEGITGAGFVVKTRDNNGNETEETIPIAFSKESNILELHHTFTSQNYGSDRMVQPYVESDYVRLVSNNCVWLNFNSSDFVPSISGMEVSMTDHLTLRIKATGTSFSRATASVGFQTFTATVTDGGILGESQLEVELPLGELPEGSYSGITLKATNDFGNTERLVNYAFSISQANYTFPTDGEKADCIRLAGIDWAKGNLYYSNGQWGIMSDPMVSSPNRSSDTYGEYFSYGYTNCSSSFPSQYDRTFASYKSSIYIHIDGNPQYDVAAANLNGWRIPTTENFGWLSYVSQQWCEDGMLYFPQINGRQFYSKTPVRLEGRPTGGLYFAACYECYRFGKFERYAGMGNYMTSEAYVHSYNNTGVELRIAVFYFQVRSQDNGYPHIISGSGSYDYCPWIYKFPVRPVKK